LAHNASAVSPPKCNPYVTVRALSLNRYYHGTSKVGPLSYLLLEELDAVVAEPLCRRTSVLLSLGRQKKGNRRSEDRNGQLNPSSRHGLDRRASLLSPSKLRSCYPGDIFDLVPTSSFVGGLRRRQLNIAAPVTAKWWHAAGTQPLHAKVARAFSGLREQPYRDATAIDAARYRTSGR
jgi:hypothetical protein